jgi:MFS family permease
VRRPRSRRPSRSLPPGFATIWSTVAIDLVGFGIVLPILPLYAERFGASPTTIGVLLASFSVAQLLCAPLWGRLSDRVGRKPVLIVSLFGTAIGSFVTGAEADFIVLDPQCTPLMARRTGRRESLEELLFALALLGDDRAIAATYAAGQLVHERSPSH